MYVLRTDIPCNVLPQELGASSTVHDRFQAWQRAKVFHALWQAGLAEYDEFGQSGVDVAGRRRSEVMGGDGRIPCGWPRRNDVIHVAVRCAV